jgi:hypothetical protein
LEGDPEERRRLSKLFKIATVRDRRIQAQGEAALRLRCALASDTVAERSRATQAGDQHQNGQPADQDHNEQHVI